MTVRQKMKSSGLVIDMLGHFIPKDQTSYFDIAAFLFAKEKICQILQLASAQIS